MTSFFHRSRSLLALAAVFAALGASSAVREVHSAPIQVADTWQVAGYVNIGEPTLRIVYDQDVPGARSTPCRRSRATSRTCPSLA